MSPGGVDGRVPGGPEPIPVDPVRRHWYPDSAFDGLFFVATPVTVRPHLSKDRHSLDQEPNSDAAASREVQAAELSERERAALGACEPAALERFYEAYFDRVYGFVRRLLREEHLAEDVTQDIFMHIHKSLPSYDPTRELRPWVFTIATNKVRDFWRSRRHRDAQRELSMSNDDGPPLAVSERRGPEELLEAGEVSQAVAAAIDDLPEIMSTTLVLRYYEGLSFETIGAMVGRNEIAVRKRYSRALDELRQRLAKVLDPNVT
jgi:RNA polymerase sigma-70 factor (ECF subfamily)